MHKAPPYKRPESVLVVLYTDDGQVLMLRRREPADFWQSVTGSLRWDETPSAAARREVREETGLGVDTLTDWQTQYRYPILPQWRSRYEPGIDTNIEHVFSYRLPAGRPIDLDPSEHLEYGWFDFAAAQACASSWTNREVIAQLQQRCRR